MAFQDITITNFTGGISSNQKTGIPNSCRFHKNLNIHEDLSYVTLHQKTTKVSGSTATDLIKWGEDGTPFDTNRWFYDASGNIYKETSGGTWSVDRSGATIGLGAAGQGLLVFDDALYYATSTTIGRKWRLSSSPSYSDNFLTDGTTDLDPGISASLDTSGSTYALPSSISESATNRQTFIPTRDPIRALEVNIAAKGSGDWTLTVHDSSNNTVGSLTIANGSLASSGDQKFTFSSPLRIVIGNSYHFHLTSSNATGTVVTTSSNDLETADFHTYFGILIADTEWHPAVQFLNMAVFGNEKYLAVWDQATYNPNKLQFAPGYKVRALTKWREYIVAACWRGSNIDSFEDGRLYFWDGILSTFNFFKETKQGLPNAITASDERLFGVYGSSGEIYINNEPFQKVQDIPKIGRGKKVEIYPGAMTQWQGQTLIGVAGSTDDSTGLEQGVYSFGSRQEGQPEVLSFPITISTGTTQGTTLKIGMVKGFGKDLYISWRDGSSYGVDKIIKTDSAATTGTWESLIFDDGRPQKTKDAFDLVIEFEQLESGESITPKYRINRADNFTSGDTVSTVGETRAQVSINQLFKEIEIGFNVASSSGTFPIITAVYFSYDDKHEERNER